MRNLEQLDVEHPRSLEEAVELLAAGGQAVAGGTDLVVGVRTARQTPNRLVYVGQIRELKQIVHDSQGARIGAAVSHAELFESTVADRLPILRQALSTIGGPAIRAMGTLGGNAANASPAADGLIPLYLLDTQVDIFGPDGERSVPIQSFIRGPGSPDLHPGELIRSFTVRFPRENPLSYFRKVGRRRALVIAIASLGSLVWVDGDRIRAARLALGSVAPTVLRPARVEEALVGCDLNAPALADIARQLGDETCPIDDVRASADYRRRVAGSLLLDMAEHLQ